MPPKGMTANPLKAPRYRPGKSVPEADSTDSESEDETPVQAAKPPPKVSAGGITGGLNKVDLNARSKAAAAREVARVEEEAALKAKEEEGFVTASEEESEDESGSEEESSEEDESEDDAPRRVMMRPTFIKKDKRSNAGAAKDTRTEEEIVEAEEARRKAAADEIVEEQIRKDTAAKLAGKKNWDDEEDEDDVDDTDDLDPEAELAAWELRELKRVKRDREELITRERELAEIERRRNLSAEERRLEDEEYISKQREEKEARPKMAVGQKYQHKGAYFLDDLKEEGLERNLMGAKFKDEVQNRELLPQSLQLRDMTKIGKRGAQKHKDLKSEDTGTWGRFDDNRGPRRGGPGGFGSDERFMPDRDRGGASGANSMPVAERKKFGNAPANAPDGPRSGDRSRVGNGRDERPRSRSRSPRPDSYHNDNRRKRSSSRDRDRYDGDKRRRIDS